MALEQTIAAQTQEVNLLTQEVAGKMAAIDAKTAQSQTDVANYIAGARMEAPFLRITPNQSLISQSGGAGSVPDGWVSDVAFSWSTLFQTVPGTQSSQPNQTEVDAFMTDTGVYLGWIVDLFAAVKVTASGLTAPTLLFNQTKGVKVSTLTFGVFVRLNSGSAALKDNTGSVIDIIADAKWHFVSARANLKFFSNSIEVTSASVDMDIALPAAIHGYFDESRSADWWLFPYPSANGGLTYT